MAAVLDERQKEELEYTKYLELLQHKGLLENSIKYHEVEDLQGVSGLKLMRSKIKYPTK